MSKFEQLIESYRKSYLVEQPTPPPSPAPDATAPAAPMPDPSAGGDPNAGAPQPSEPEISVEDAIDEIYQDSKKPWVDLANVLAKAMFYNFTSEEIETINDRLSENNEVAVNVEDFRDYLDNESRGVSTGVDPHKESIKGAAIRVFQIVKDVMDESNVGSTVVRATDR